MNTSLFEIECNELARIYGKQIGIPKRRIPPVYTSVRRFNKNDTCDGYRIGKKIKASSRNALYCQACNIIYVNRKNVPTIKEEVEAVVHELIHCKWFSMPHGKRLNRRVDLIMNGKRYK